MVCGIYKINADDKNGKTGPESGIQFLYMKVRALFPLRDRGRSTQIGHRQLTSSLIKCTIG